MSNVSKCFFCANKKEYDAKFGYFGCAYSGQECKDYSMFEPKVKPKPITNADRIRSMSDEELAKKMSGLESFALTCGGGWPPEKWLDWLKEEVKEE